MASIIQNQPLPGQRTFRGGLRTLLGAAKRAVAEYRTPVVLAPIEQPVADPDGLFTADEMPPLEIIETEAAKFARATEQARTADRTKRAARKILDKLPAGRYGAWTVERVDNAREVADLERIKAIFKANGLGDVPMKPCAPSLKISLAPVEASPEQVEAELQQLAGVAR